MSVTIKPQVPFVWPEPRVTAGSANYPNLLPFEAVACAASSIFGVVSALDARAVNWMEGYLADNIDSKLRIVISFHPTCRTTDSDIENLLRLVERHGPRAAFKVFPEVSLEDRSSNLLCLCNPDGSAAVTIGPTENMGFAERPPSQANLVCTATAATVEACRKWFDYLWGISGDLRPEVATTMPHLVLPEGDIEAARLWEEYRARCFANISRSINVTVDPTTGEVILKDRNDQVVASPTEEIGIPQLDVLAEAIARVFDLGVLVAVDKTSRIPPLEAPVRPEWFGVDSFRQTGMVRAQTSIKVAPFDESTLKKVDRLLKVSGDLLPRYSFALADGVRWMPKQAIPLFESALTIANEEAKTLLGSVVGKNIDEFLDSQRDRIRADAQRMYEGFHPGEKIPEKAVTDILNELNIRLGKTRGEALIPKVTYSPVAFQPGKTTKWSSPWGQAFQLLKGIAAFPREAMTDRFFWRGIRTTEDELVKAMDVAGDYLVADYGSRNATRQATQDLDLIEKLETSTADAREKCEALWKLIRTGVSTIEMLLPASADEKPVQQDLLQ